LEKPQYVTAERFVYAPGVRGETPVKFTGQRPDHFAVHFCLDDFSEKLESKIVYLRRQSLARGGIVRSRVPTRIITPKLVARIQWVRIVIPTIAAF
jgi:hypothetical protein